MSKLNVQNTLKAKYANDKTPKPKAKSPNTYDIANANFP